MAVAGELRTGPTLYKLQYKHTYCCNITGGRSKQGQILLLKISKYGGFCVYRKSYLIWSLVIVFPLYTVPVEYTNNDACLL